MIKNGKEVKSMLFEEFDMEMALKVRGQEEREEGRAEGRAEGERLKELK